MDFATKERLESLYARLPVGLQNLAFSIYGLTLRYQRYGRYFHRKLGEIRPSSI